MPTTMVTGAASGIGRAIATAFAGRDHHVVVTDVDGAAATAVAEHLRVTGHAASAYRLDVTDAHAFVTVVDAVEQEQGTLDVLVNNAGVPIGGPSHELPLARWRQVVDVNLMGVIHGVTAVYPRMVARGAGMIVNTASLSAFTAVPTSVAYAASKHAVLGLSRSLRGEGAVHGVRVHVLCPGFVDTPLLHHEESGGHSFARVSRTLRHPVVTPEQVATALLRGLDRDRGVIITPRSAALTRWAEVLAPQRVTDVVYRRLARRFLAG